MTPRDIIIKYILPTYPEALEWYDNLTSDYNVIQLRDKHKTVGLAITRGIKLCTFVILEEYRGMGYGDWFIRRLDVKYVKSKNYKLKGFF